MAILWLPALAPAYQLEHQYRCASRTDPDSGLVPGGDRLSGLSRQVGSSPTSCDRGLSIEDDDRRRPVELNRFAWTNGSMREALQIWATPETTEVLRLECAMSGRNRHPGAMHGGRADPDEVPVIHQWVDSRHRAANEQSCNQ